MAATTKALLTSGPLERTDAPATIPSPAQVRATAAEIRRSWTPDQRRRRAKLARCMLWQQFLADATIPPAPQRALTPKCPEKRS